MQVITTHLNADFDGLASLVAATKLYPGAQAVLPTSLNKNVQEYVSLYKDQLPFKTSKELALDEMKQLVITDTRQRQRLGSFAKYLDQLTEIHLYDHHPESADDLAAQYMVVGNVGATITLLWEKISTQGITISPFEATLFALGLYEDTGGFTFENTTERDVAALHQLWQVGVNLRVVNQFLKQPLNDQQRDLLDELLDATEYYELRGVRVGIATAANGDYVDGLGSLTQKLLEIEDVDLMLTAAAMGNKVYLVGRSRVEEINVSDLMAVFGGKGHRAAASAMVKDTTLAAVQEQLIKVLAEEVKPVTTAREMMTAPVRSISPETSIQEAQELMLRYGHSGFPVVSEGQLVGIISRRDLEKAMRHGLGHAPVKGYMSRKPVTVAPEMSLREVQHIMITKDMGRLPVVEGEEIIGIITRTDLLDSLEGSKMKIKQQGESPAFPSAGQDITTLFMERLPQKLQSLLYLIGQTADREQSKVYAVGGFVRDLLLGLETHDLDLAVEPLAIPFGEKLHQVLGGQIKKHEQFGTVTLTMRDDLQIDLVTARQEFYARPAAMPEVELGSLKNDLFRRDFTINTLAVSLNMPHYGQLIDFFHGLSDLESGLIRILYNLSFVEDPLRLLRAIRFEQRFAFQLEETTQALLENAVKTRVLENVSKERLYDELSLIFQEKKIAAMLNRIFELGLDVSIFPGVRYHELLKQRLFTVQEVLACVQRTWLDAKPIPAALYLASLMLDLRFQEARHLCRRLRLPRDTIRRVLNAITVVPQLQEELTTDEELKPSQLEHWLGGQPLETMLLLLVVSKHSLVWSRIYFYWEKIRPIQIEISGHDLEVLGLPPGPAYQEILTAVRAARVDGLVGNKEEELAFVQQQFQRDPPWGKEN
ncbi:MAG TPA: CBS domain-containing protein [Oscillospiraceae bacterium]|nr:CBS domain-containing protein [Oscillospiraceae bacterium]